MDPPNGCEIINITHEEERMKKKLDQCNQVKKVNFDLRTLVLIKILNNQVKVNVIHLKYRKVNDFKR